MMYVITNSIHKVYKGAAEQIVPVRGQSAFKEKGVLTPDEFVAAGNKLVRTCPTWSWEAGDGGSKWSFLPRDRQFLITRTVPCHRRAAAVDLGERLLETANGEAETWIAPGVESRAEREIPDIDESPDDLSPIEEDDEAALSAPTGSILRTRTYDLLVSYDKYYQVPRFWLVGYDDARHPLPVSKVLEDVSEEHASKTITVEKFPHMPMITAASIHPCKHAVTMKKLSSMIHITVDRYIILFLKFIASVVPTIEYDYTMAAGL